MARTQKRDKRVVQHHARYQVVEIEIVHHVTDELISTCYEVREGDRFVTEFDTEREALEQLQYLLGLEPGNGSGP